MLKPVRLAAILGLILLVGACSASIRKVESESYGWGPQKGVTLAQVQSVIENVTRSEGWELSNIQPGSFTARRAWGGNKHSIAVDVIYDTRTFSIRYKDSKMMGYDGSSIHHTYNNMVQALEDKIKEKVSPLTA